MSAKEFIGLVKDGRLPRDTERDIDRLLALYEGKAVKLSIKEAKSKRTLKQNDYYKGFIIPEFIKFAREQYGNNLTKETADIVLKEMVGFTEPMTYPDGTEKELPKSTAELEKGPMSEFTNNVIATLATEWGCILPPERGTEDLIHR